MLVSSRLKVNATMGSEVLLDIWPAVKKLKVMTMLKRAKILLHKETILLLQRTTMIHISRPLNVQLYTGW